MPMFYTAKTKTAYVWTPNGAKAEVCGPWTDPWLRVRIVLFNYVYFHCQYIYIYICI